MTIDQKLALYNDYFSLDYRVKVNIEPFALDANIPDKQAFLDEMPYPFRLAAEINQIDGSALRPLRNLSHQADDLVSFLNHQAKKIDLIMSYILSMEDQAEQRFYTEQFGAGGIVISGYPTALTIGQTARVKLFLTEEASAVYCFAEVLEIIETDTTPSYKLVFTQIREDDREILIKASLHQQTRHLRKIAEKRNQE